MAIRYCSCWLWSSARDHGYVQVVEAQTSERQSRESVPGLSSVTQRSGKAYFIGCFVYKWYEGWNPCELCGGVECVMEWAIMLLGVVFPLAIIVGLLVLASSR